MYSLEYTSKAKQQITDLPSQKIRNQIEAAVLRLAQSPNIGKPLQGDLKGLYSYRSENYRIIYQALHKELRILVIALGNRRDIYSRHL